MEKRIGLFYGSDTGTTEGIANELEKLIATDFEVEVFDMCNVEKEKLSKFNYYIFGLSTWYDGQLQSDWDLFFDDFCKIDFSGKIAAFFGCGDQYGFPEYFIDGVGIVAKQFEKAGGTVIGNWSIEGYDFEVSKAQMDEHYFYGLPIDEDNQAELTTERLAKWSKQLKKEFMIDLRKVIEAF